MCGRQRFHINDAGFDLTVMYTRRTVRRVFGPLAEEIAAGFRAHPVPAPHVPARRLPGARPDRDRYLLALSGPPGSGKSSVAALLCQLLAKKGIRALVLPLDGFHMKNKELKRKRIRIEDRDLSLYERKGAKESYDVEGLFQTMSRLKTGDPLTWPVYSRTLHEPVEEGVRVQGVDCLCIIEGNYLLLDVEPWVRLRSFFDKKILILGKRSLMRRRIVSRKMRGGFTKMEAEAHFRRSDALNIAEVIERSGGYDLLLEQRGRYGLTLRRAQTRNR